jgi:DNA (cytosine-5)-methyltransferase 1
MVPESYVKPLSKKLGSLIEEALSSGEELESILEREGLSYENLRYESSPSPQLFDSNYKTLSDYRKPFHGVPVVSFFSGCGGLDLGFEAAGFDHFCLIEHSEIFCETLRKNRDWEVLGPPYSDGDVSQRTKLSEQLDKLGLKKNFNGVFVGGPPCQPFSIAANQRFSKNGENFKRVGFEHETNGNLLFDYVWYIEKYLPKAFLIENVSGLIDVDGGKQLSKVYESLTKKGYTLHQPLKINAAHYGVPQQRERVFIVGYKGKNEFSPPKPQAEVIACINALVNIDKCCPNHITRKHKASTVSRYVKLNIGKRDKLGRVDRLDPSLPSKTVIAGGSSGGGRSHLHPYIPRTLSVRESARLQTFPDNYVFTGSSARQFTQVGNAVPPILGAQLAQAIYESFFQKA